MSAVPRKSEAIVSGLERARIGASLADARQGSARADALEVARSDALRALESPSGLAEWCTLAAGNIDYGAKVLLELSGQDARGVLRTRAWILRNGARIRKGERGLAVSMFGAYVWPLSATTERFGGFGMAEYGDVPPDALAGWASLVDRDMIAAGILCAMRGYRLTAVFAAGKVDAERLDLALRRARGVAWNLPACLSCDGAGCVLCSCSDDRCRQGEVTCTPMPEPKPKSVASKPAKIGRPRLERHPLPEVAAAMREVRRLRDEADRLRAEAAELEYQALATAWADHSVAEIALTVGVSRARVHQIVNSR